jgi:hypothetical protein
MLWDKLVSNLFVRGYMKECLFYTVLNEWYVCNYCKLKFIFKYDIISHFVTNQNKLDVNQGDLDNEIDLK